MESTSWDAALIPAYIESHHHAITPNGLHAEHTSWDAALIPEIYIITSLHYSTNRESTQPRNRASAQPCNPCRASGAPRIAQASGNPLHDSNSLPCSIVKRHCFSVTHKGRESPITSKGLTLLPGLVRDPRISHLGVSHSHRNALHTILCRLNDMPDSSGLGKPPSRTLLLSLWGLPVRPTSLRTIHHWSLARLHARYLTQSCTVEFHNNSFCCNYSRNYNNSRNKLVNLTTITKRLYLILQTRLLPSRIHTQLTNSPCHRMRPPPIRQQSPTPTTGGR